MVMNYIHLRDISQSMYSYVLFSSCIKNVHLFPLIIQSDSNNKKFSYVICGELFTK
jgi:hypothetical protein